MPGRLLPSSEPARAGARADETAIPAAGVALAFLTTLALFFDGVGPMDSMKYVAAAMQWFDGGPFIGEDQWALRAPLVAPVAAAYALFGPGEFASAFPNMLFSAGLAAVTFIYGRRHLGPSAGLAAAILVATSPFFVVVQSQVWIAGPEILAVALACWIFIGMYGATPDPKRFAIIGFLSGLAWLCRETAAFLPACIALLALMRWPRRLDVLFALCAGFAVVVGAEMLAYHIAAGDAFYRYKIDFGHRGEGEFYEAYSPAGEALSLLERLIQPFGHMLTRPAITPFLLLGAAALFAPGMRRALLSASLRAPAIVFGLCALVSFLSASYGAALRSPVYYPIVIYAALLVLGVLAGRLFDGGRRRRAAALMLALIAIGAAAADFRNYGEQAEARYLAGHVAATREAVVTDPHTSFRTRTFLRFAGAKAAEAQALVKTPKDVGGRYCGLVFAGTPKGLRRVIEPEAQWRAVWSQPVRKPRLSHQILLSLGAGEIGPARMKDILIGAKPPILYQAPPCPLR